MPREGAVQDATIRLLKQRGAYHVKVHQTGRGRRGIADLSACYRGIYLALEIKGDGGKATNHQLKELRDVRQAGGVAMIVYGAPQVAVLLDGIDELFHRKMVNTAALIGIQPWLPPTAIAEIVG